MPPESARRDGTIGVGIRPLAAPPASWRIKDVRNHARRKARAATAAQLRSPLADISKSEAAPQQLANLAKRFDRLPREVVAEALAEADGHAGRAAAKLRVVMDSRQHHQRKPHRSGPNGHAVVAQSSPPPVQSHPRGPHSRGQHQAQDTAPESEHGKWAGGRGPKIAITPEGTGDGRILVRRVRELCRSEHCVVHEATDRNAERFALKHTQREKAGRRRWMEAQHEAAVTRAIGEHPFLVEMRGMRDDSQNLYLLLELCTGGDLCARLDEVQRLDQRTTAFYAAQLALALRHLHKQRANPRAPAGEPMHYIHRDIKPENIFVCADGYLKLGDFGFTKRLFQSERTHTRCGTSEYMAPEVVRNVGGNGYSRATDCWSLGVVLYECLCGVTPFGGYESEMDIYHAILTFAKAGSAEQLDWSGASGDAATAAASPRRTPCKTEGRADCGGRRQRPIVDWLLTPSPSPRRQHSGSGNTNGHAATTGGSSGAGQGQPRRRCPPPSPSCGDFIGALMRIEPSSRLGMGPNRMDEILQHPWLSAGETRIDLGQLERKRLAAPWVPSRTGHTIYSPARR